MKKLLSIICGIAMLCCTATLTASAVSQEDTHNTPIVSKTEDTVRAESLANKSLKDLFKAMGDNYTLAGEYGHLYIEDDYYPSMRFATSYTISDDRHYDTVSNEEKNTITTKIESGEITLVSVDCFPGVDVMVDDTIKTDMDYIQLSQIIGEFQCETGGLWPSYTIKDGNGKALASFLYSNQNSELVSENGHISVETMKSVNPKVSRISVYPGYYPVYLEKATNTGDLVTTASDLAKMDLNDIIKMLGSEFDVRHIRLNNLVSRNSGSFANFYYIANDELLPGVRIYTDYMGGNVNDYEGDPSEGKFTPEAADRIKTDLINGNHKLYCVLVENGASLDSNIKAGMTYSQLKDIIGEFTCYCGVDGKNSYFSNLEIFNAGDTENHYSKETAMVVFDFDPKPEDIEHHENYAEPAQDIISDSTMTKANPNIDYIVVYPEYTSLNGYTESAYNPNNTDSDNKSSKTIDGNDDNDKSTAENTNSSDSTNNSTVKSPATSTLGADSTMPLFGIAGVLLIAIVGCIYSAAVYRHRKDTV